MSERSDKDIANDFDELFEQIPDFETEEEINKFLIEEGYDPKLLEVIGEEFVAEIMAKNWRYVSISIIDAGAEIINKIPLRTGWDKSRLIEAIKHSIDAIAPKKFAAAHRNFEEMKESDLASLLQELEAEAIKKGIKLNLK